MFISVFVSVAQHDLTNKVHYLKGKMSAAEEADQLEKESEAQAASYYPNSFFNRLLSQRNASLFYAVRKKTTACLSLHHAYGCIMLMAAACAATCT